MHWSYTKLETHIGVIGTFSPQNSLLNGVQGFNTAPLDNEKLLVHCDIVSKDKHHFEATHFRT